MPTEELLARIRVHLTGAKLVASAHAAIEAAGHALFAVGQDGRMRWATPNIENRSSAVALTLRALAM